MGKVNQAKIPLSLSEFNWKLVRERDGLTRKSKDVKWIEWSNDGVINKKFENVAVGRSLIMSPFNIHYTWQTTLVTEVVEQRDNYIKFKTQNSDYELFKL